MTIVPGFIDCHCHADRGAILLYEVLVGNPFEAEFVTIDSIIRKLADRARQTPPGFWVEGYFYDDTKVTDKREVTLRDLDRVSTAASGGGPPPRRPHDLLQQQGAGARGHHAGHARSTGRNL